MQEIEDLKKARQEKSYNETELKRMENLKVSEAEKDYLQKKISALKAEVEFWGNEIRLATEDVQELSRHVTFLIAKLEGIKKSLAGIFDEFASIDRGTALRFEQIRGVSLELIGPRDQIDVLLIGLKSDKKQIEGALR
jgi:predicted  nucleic acid-binding Zn-ribbon protein